MNEIDSVAARVRGSEDLTEICSTVAGWARDRRLDDLVRLAGELLGAAGGEREQTIVHEIEEQIALVPGQESVDAILSLLGLHAPSDRELRTRLVASRLGAAQAKETLLANLERRFEEEVATELLVCWLHEAVLRGAAFGAEPRAARARTALEARGHALAGLPLALLDIEREAPSYLPMYGETALTRAVERLERGSVSARTMPPPTEHEATRATLIVDPDLEARMRVALEPWLASAKGKVEAKLFRVEPAIPSTALAKWLLRVMDLECAPVGGRLFANRTAGDAVFGMLFAAAANGGSSSPGLGGAYGRMAAFTSMGALVGAGPDALPAEVDQRARSSTYLSFFASEGGFFHDVAWDVGALVLRPDGDTVAVLAGTDAV
jgi:hypothetical protein